MLCTQNPVLLVDNVDPTCRALVTEANFLARPKPQRHAVAAMANALPLHAVVVSSDWSAVFITETGVRLLNSHAAPPLAIEFNAADLPSITRTLAMLPGSIPNVVVPHAALRAADARAMCQFRAITHGTAKITVRDHTPAAPAWATIDIAVLQPTCAFWIPGTTDTHLGFTPRVVVPPNAVVWRPTPHSNGFL